MIVDQEVKNTGTGITTPVPKSDLDLTKLRFDDAKLQ